MPGRQLVLLSVGTLLALAGIFVIGLTPPSEESAASLAVSALGMELFLAGVAVAGASLSLETPTGRLGLGPGRLPGASLALLVVGTIALSHGLDGVLHATGLREDSIIAEIDARLSGARGATLLIAILGIGIAPGIAEELLCRGWLQRGLERRIGAPLAIAAATLFFGALHGDSVHSAAAVGLGAYLGIIAWLAGSVRASILCHTANNLAAVLALAWELPIGVASLWTMPAGFGIAGTCLAVVWRRAGSPEQRWTPTRPEPRHDSRPSGE